MKTISISRGLSVTIDDRDFKLVNQNKWTACKSKKDNTWYATRSIKIDGKWKHISMHRMIMGNPKGVKIDHKDGNGLNNTRGNLRPCTHAQNLMNMRVHNKHGLKGVAFIKNLKPARQWMAKIRADGKMKTIGYFPSAVDAAIAYNEMAVRHFGEFAKLNQVASAK